MPTKDYKTIRDRMPAKDRSEAKRKAEKMLSEMPLQELRQARRYSQEELASSLGKKQSQISKIERGTDMYLSTMRRYIEAMGGQLEITAHFPDGVVRIEQFQSLEEPQKKRKKTVAA